MMMRLLIVLIFVSANVVGQVNQNISNYVFPDTEPTITVDPSNPSVMVSAWMRITGINKVTIAISSSSDGGDTWSNPALMPHLYSSFTHADPSFAISASGDIYLCYIDYLPTKDSGFVMVSTSNDGGLTWNTPVTVFSSYESTDLPVDRPWICVDRSGGAFHNRIYITSKSVDSGTLPHHVWMKYSSNSGATWSQLKMIDDSIATSLVTNSMGIPTVGADGNLYISYLSWMLSASVYPRFICSRSTDGGQSFTPYVMYTATSSSPGITDSLYQGSYYIAANPVNPSNVIAIITENSNGDPDILSMHSNDHGITWSAPVRIHSDPLANGIGQDMCWGAFSSTGTFHAAWRDRRNGGTGSSAPFEIYTTYSIDGGISFSTDKSISTQASPVVPVTRGNDFLGVCAAGNNIYSNWCDLRNGNMEIFLASDTIAPVSVNETANNIFILYPNPGKNELIIEMKEHTGKYSIEISDVKGSTVYRSKNNTGKKNINTSNFIPGNYMVTISADERVYSQQWQKN